MKKRNIICLLLLCGISCHKNSDDIQLVDVYGTYEYTYKDDDPQWHLIKHVIAIKADTTYEHKMYHGNILLIDEQGHYKFNRYNPSVSFLEFTNYSKYMEETPTREKSSMYMIKKGIFGQIYLTFNWPFDPDGAPIRPKYKKVK